jgi:L-lactate dehydrogenase complex protein LldE
MSNSGDQANAAAAERLFVDIFKEYDYIIGPAGSCVKQVCQSRFKTPAILPAL